MRISCVFFESNGAEIFLFFLALCFCWTFGAAVVSLFMNSLLTLWVFWLSEASVNIFFFFLLYKFSSGQSKVFYPVLSREWQSCCCRGGTWRTPGWMSLGGRDAMSSVCPLSSTPSHGTAVPRASLVVDFLLALTLFLTGERISCCASSTHGHPQHLTHRFTDFQHWTGSFICPSASSWPFISFIFSSLLSSVCLSTPRRNDQG